MPTAKKDVYLAMLEMVNSIHNIRNQTNEAETAIMVEKMFAPLAVVLQHLEECPHRRLSDGR